MLLINDHIQFLEDQFPDEAIELEPILTIEQNEKLYSIYINIILNLYCEYARSNLNLSIFRNSSEIKAEIYQYTTLSESVADRILKQRRIS
jgi:hypothetical protein